MPQQLLRSKRNNLRFANNYKRDHFTQGLVDKGPRLSEPIKITLGNSQDRNYKEVKRQGSAAIGNFSYTTSNAVVTWDWKDDLKQFTDATLNIDTTDVLDDDFENEVTPMPPSTNVNIMKSIGSIRAKVEGGKLKIQYVLPEEQGFQYKFVSIWHMNKDADTFKMHSNNREPNSALTESGPPRFYLEDTVKLEWVSENKKDFTTVVTSPGENYGRKFWLTWNANIPAKPVDGTDVEYILENGTPTLKIYTEDTFYVEYFDDANQILNNGQGEEKGKGSFAIDIPGVKKVRISRQNGIIRSGTTILNTPRVATSRTQQSSGPPLEGVALEWKDHIGGSGSITNCAHVNSARNMLGLGSDFDCQETFMQRPDNFPHSKVDDFSQDWEALLTKFDSDLGAIGSGIGSYTSSRDDILGEILTAVKAGDYRGVQLITDMSKGLYAAAESIEAKVNALEGIKRNFNDISGSGLGKYDSLRTKATTVIN